MLLLELFRSRVESECAEVGLEEGSGVKKDAGRRFFKVAEVGTGGSLSSIGVRAFMGGRKMLKLFRRRRSDIVLQFLERRLSNIMKHRKRIHDETCGF